MATNNMWAQNFPQGVSGSNAMPVTVALTMSQLQSAMSGYNFPASGPPRYQSAMPGQSQNIPQAVNGSTSMPQNQSPMSGHNFPQVANGSSTVSPPQNQLAMSGNNLPASGPASMPTPQLQGHRLPANGPTSLATRFQSAMSDEQNAPASVYNPMLASWFQCMAGNNFPQAATGSSSMPAPQLQSTMSGNNTPSSGVASVPRLQSPMNGHNLAQAGSGSASMAAPQLQSTTSGRNNFPAGGSAQFQSAASGHGLSSSGSASMSAHQLPMSGHNFPANGSTSMPTPRLQSVMSGQNLPAGGSAHLQSATSGHGPSSRGSTSTQAVQPQPLVDNTNAYSCEFAGYYALRNGRKLPAPDHVNLHIMVYDTSITASTGASMNVLMFIDVRHTGSVFADGSVICAIAKGGPHPQHGFLLNVTRLMFLAFDATLYEGVERFQQVHVTGKVLTHPLRTLDSIWMDIETMTDINGNKWKWIMRCSMPLATVSTFLPAVGSIVNVSGTIQAFVADVNRKLDLTVSKLTPWEG